jgi:hypothetical protein
MIDLNDADPFRSLSEERKRRLSQIAQWRRDGCCTFCGCVLLGDVTPLDEEGAKFFGGPPHLAGDRMCFWCFESWTECQPDEPSRYQGGRA